MSSTGSSPQHTCLADTWEYWSWIDWRTNHPHGRPTDVYDLSVGEMGLTLAVAWDWLHDDLSDAERALLLRLDRRGALAHDPSRTNWENLSAATARLAVLRKPMTGLALAVDECVYGSVPASPATWEQCRELARSVWFVEASDDE